MDCGVPETLLALPPVLWRRLEKRWDVLSGHPSKVRKYLINWQYKRDNTKR